MVQASKQNLPSTAGLVEYQKISSKLRWATRNDSGSNRRDKNSKHISETKTRCLLSDSPSPHLPIHFEEIDLKLL